MLHQNGAFGSWIFAWLINRSPQTTEIECAPQEERPVVLRRMIMIMIMPALFALRLNQM